MISLAAPEAATNLAWRLGPTGEFQSTGSLSSIDSRTGRPAPNPTFELPPNARATTIEVRYDDATGRPIGPFPIAFDPRVELVRGQREILERFSNSWVAFGSGAPRNDLLYYTQLMSFRCALAKVEIGVGDGALNAVPMPPCNERDPNAIPADAKPYIGVPASAKRVSVRLTFADGGQSPVKIFTRP
jgi:hypothetical protein